MRNLLYVITDKAALQLSKAPRLLQIGEKLTKGFGAGANPEIGVRAIGESTDDVAVALSGAEMIIDCNSE